MAQQALRQSSTRKLYKDCLRLAEHAAKTTGADPKKLKETIRQSFKKNMFETDPDRIASLREE